MIEERWCAGCGRDEVFEAPACEDGHGGDCPERACTVCGALALAGPAPLAPRLEVLTRTA